MAVILHPPGDVSFSGDPVVRVTVKFRFTTAAPWELIDVLH
jgi:hypothetical protein